MAQSVSSTPSPTAPSFIIYAKMSGYCPSCNEIIKEGDPITQDGMLYGKWVHDTCYLPNTDDESKQAEQRRDNNRAARTLMKKLDNTFNKMIDPIMHSHERNYRDQQQYVIQAGLEWIDTYEEMMSLVRKAFRY